MTDTPNFHDGYFTGIQLDGKGAVLSIERVNGESWRVALSGVQALQLDDFQQGNIIQHFAVMTKVLPPRDALERLFTPPHPSADARYHDDHERLLQRKADMVLAGEAVLLMIVPSCGADFLALCGSVNVAKLPS